MKRSVRSVAAVVAAAMCLWPMAVAAQDASPPVAQILMTTEQARTALAEAGYQVDEALNWEWTSPPVSAFRVHDAAQGRVLMVLVYPNTDATELARSRGPHLVVGFGESVWKGNVALVQTNQTDLDRVYRWLNDRASGMPLNQNSGADPSQPSVAVDLDFLQALNASVVNL
jgi:hypothetical protein